MEADDRLALWIVWGLAFTCVGAAIGSTSSYDVVSIAFHVGGVVTIFVGILVESGEDDAPGEEEQGDG